MMCKVICDISTSHVRLEVRSAAANEDKNTRKDGNPVVTAEINIL